VSALAPPRLLTAREKMSAMRLKLGACLLVTNGV
jgi:hypothetical protein